MLANRHGGDKERKVWRHECDDFTEAKNCPLCRVFGATGSEGTKDNHPAALLVRDGKLSNFDQLEQDGLPITLEDQRRKELRNKVISYDQRDRPLPALNRGALSWIMTKRFTHWVGFDFRRMQMNEDIIEILESIDDNIDWQTEYLDEIEGWADVIENLNEPVPAQVEHYFEEILPLQWKVFRTVNQYRIDKNQLTLKDHYDVGIFLVGFSEIPIILSLATLQPEYVYFLYSRESRDILKLIPDGIEQIQPDMKNRVEDAIQNPQFALLIPDSSDPVETFKIIKQVIQNAQGKTIAIDITGGKKPMISGGFTTVSIRPDCDIFYIDFRYYDVRRRRPVYGTEFLSKLDNPYEVYDVQSLAEAKKLFQQHNYEAAEELLNTISENLNLHAEQYGLEQEQEDVKNYLEMTTCYKFWDALDYKEAQKHKGDWEYQQQHASNGSIDVLDILSENEYYGQKKKTYKIKNQKTLCLKESDYNPFRIESEIIPYIDARNNFAHVNSMTIST